MYFVAIGSALSLGCVLAVVLWFAKWGNFTVATVLWFVAAGVASIGLGAFKGAMMALAVSPFIHSPLYIDHVEQIGGLERVTSSISPDKSYYSYFTTHALSNGKLVLIPHKVPLRLSVVTDLGAPDEWLVVYRVDSSYARGFLLFARHGEYYAFIVPDTSTLSNYLNI